MLSEQASERGVAATATRKQGSSPLILQHPDSCEFPLSPPPSHTLFPSDPLLLPQTRYLPVPPICGASASPNNTSWPKNVVAIATRMDWTAVQTVIVGPAAVWLCGAVIGLLVSRSHVVLVRGLLGLAMSTRSKCWCMTESPSDSTARQL